MALVLHSISSSSFIAKKPHLLLLHASLLPFPSKPASLSIKSQDSSAPLPDDGSSSIPKKPISPGLGFGSASSSSSKSKPNPVSSKKKQKGKRERASIIRRSPVEKPEFVAQQDEAQAKDQVRNENAFLLTWLGLGALILAEGIALAASGFLPEEWDNFFVKYLYPSFTPTVFLFVAGTVVYGVYKYLENEKLTSQK